MLSLVSSLQQTDTTTLLSPLFLQIIFTLIAAASAAPQIVPYVHEEIAAEPYIHQEIAAEPYVHIEPALTPEALGEVAYAAAPVVATGYAAAPVVAWTGGCLNNLGQAVPCRQ